ncbi:NAD-dependent epimerase/dehydratase family protein [Xanthobacter autotrophicus]|uniref:NAD-dependent epimerase/dehydratase family protein n=1 Tax=Xanthobacter autotrophicus TaxID=280 RepID=UPI00372B0367
MQGANIIFGGSGFVGTHLARKLTAAGEAVISADIKPQRETLPGVDYRVTDVRDLSGFEVNQPVKCIYNFAAIHTTPGHPFWEYYDTNINGALEVKALAERLNVPEIVFTSSISVYGPSESMKDENTKPTPESAYGYSKLMAERVHRLWFNGAPGRKLTIVRPAVVFGQGERGNFTRLARLLEKGFFIFPGRKDTIKACVYVEDLLDAIGFAQQSPEPFKFFNAAYPERYTLEQVVSLFIEDHFPKGKTYMIPRGVVMGMATALGKTQFLNIGIHPERVTKLVRSTDIFPYWLGSQGYTFPYNLREGLKRWAVQSNKSFD